MGEICYYNQLVICYQYELQITISIEFLMRVFKG